jgi:hypothetical protein
VAIDLPVLVLPLLSSKPPLLFLTFLAIVLFLKFRETKAIKNGYTKEQYSSYCRTKKGSLNFSLFVMVLFIVTAILDLIIYIVVSVMLNVPAIIEGGDPNEVAPITSNVVSSLGLGECLALLFAAPIVVLYSYMKEPKPTKYDLVIPFAGIGLILFAILEGVFLVVSVLLL